MTAQKREVSMSDSGTARKGALAVTTIVLSVACTAVAVSAALNSRTQAPHAVARGSQIVVRTGADKYPPSACANSDPTTMLLPVSAIPQMVQGTSSIAEGGRPLNPLGIAMGGGTPASMMSAATVSEHFFNSSAPASAIQNADPYNVTNPHAVTTFDEGITGFTSSSAESLFFGRAVPPQAPTDDVNGQLESEQMNVQQNVAGIPTPNVVVTTGISGTDEPDDVQVTIEEGSTVVGLGFEGGDALSLSDVHPYVNSALQQLQTTCGSADVMVGGK